MKALKYLALLCVVAASAVFLISKSIGNFSQHLRELEMLLAFLDLICVPLIVWLASTLIGLICKSAFLELDY